MEKVVTKVVKTAGVLFLLFSGMVNAQVVPPLERVVTVELTGQSSRDALKLIEEQGDLTFAYKTDIVDGSNSMHRTYADQSVREVLNDLFQGALTYREKGEYVILRPAPKVPEQEVVLEGYVLDALSGEKIPYASVYDTVSFGSAVSDEYGHYKVKLSTKDNIVMRVRKDGYRDTTFKWVGEMQNVMNVRIYPEITEIPEDTLSADSVTGFFQRLKNKKFIKMSDEQKANLINFKEKLTRNAQFSIIPGVGTNGRLSGVTTVDYSFNLFGGFNGGVRKVEFGGLFNIVWDSVSYFQMAGIFNAVGGPVNGMQLAGITNLNNSSVDGMQLAGMLNVARKEVKGMQLGGFANAAMKVDGMQLGGFANAAMKADGMQLAGFANALGDSSEAVQLSGFTNYAHRNNSGAQISGFFNVALQNYKGLQIAGFGNLAGGRFEGMQLSSMINIAENIKGMQLGFINVSDSIDGVPIGFLSFSRKGLHQLEISGTETFPANVAFRTGTNQFYNTFAAGGHFSNSARPVWRYGYGVGSSVRLSPKSRLYFDLQSSLLQEGGKKPFNASLNTFDITYNYQLTDKISIAAGPSYNVLVSQLNAGSADEHIVSIAPYDFYNQNTGNANVRMWVGGKVALRFF